MAEGAVRLQLGGVSDETGRELRDRRLRLGMSVRQLAKLAGVDKDTLAGMESGEKRPHATTVAKVQGALDRLDEELGMDEDAGQDEPGIVEFRVTGNFGVDVVVKDPVRDLPALEESVNRIVSRMQGESRENHPT